MFFKLYVPNIKHSTISENCSLWLSFKHQKKKFSDDDFHPKCSIKPFVQPVQQQQQQQPEMGRKPSQNQPEVDRKPIELKHIHTGDTKVRAKLRFEVVTARVIETGGKKHVVSSKVQKCILK